MREIRFRAWDKVKKRMWWNVQNAYDTLHCHNVPDDSDDCNCDPFQHCFTPCSFGEVLIDKNFVVMQFTGLRDSKGKEIWEGDIIREKFRNNPNRFVKIIYIPPEFLMQNKYGHMRFSTHMDLEVIGNVFENPELLGTKK